MDDPDSSNALLHSVALRQAVLCADCEIISNSVGETCEVCGSRSLLSLGRVLGGCIGDDRAVLVDVERCYANGFTVLVSSEASNVLRRRHRNSRG